MTNSFSLLITFIAILFISSCKKQDGDSLLEIKARIAMTKAAFNIRKKLFTKRLKRDLKI